LKKATTVKEYIQQIPLSQRKQFNELHELIVQTASDAEQCISYGMPAIKQFGIVVYYANWEKHMAIYPMPSALKAFADSLDAYVTSKSTIQFPHGKSIPKKLIKNIVKFRLDENKKKWELKKKK
jgi:uncharacterized protein YdhG (YjbR/CyaY superfamily)